MKLSTALIAVLLTTAGPALAQTPGATTPAAPAPHAPATPVQPGHARPDAPPAEKIDPAKDAAIRHLLDVTDSSKIGENITAYITAQVQQGVSRALPADQLPKFMSSFSEKFAANLPPNAVNDAIVAIYARHFSLEDIQGLVKFYESPLGQRVVKEMPEVNQQMRTVGQQLEGAAARESLRSMADDYPQLKQMLAPENPAPSSAPAPGAGAAAPKLPPSTLKPADPER
ncbi:MAG: DUF2059 domain-containing protein [Candidatus Acidiferrales bacterium]